MSKPPNPKDEPRPIGDLTAAVVSWCSRHAWLVVILAALAGSAFGWVAINRLSIDTDTDRLLSEKLVWRQREIAFDKEFPQNSDLIAVVVNASTPEQAENATARLTAKLSTSKLFTSVSRPDGGPFFDKNGLMLLPVSDVQNLASVLLQSEQFGASIVKALRVHADNQPAPRRNFHPAPQRLVVRPAEVVDAAVGHPADIIGRNYRRSLRTRQGQLV